MTARACSGAEYRPNDTVQALRLLLERAERGEVMGVAYTASFRSIAKGGAQMKMTMICRNCGTVGNTVSEKPGSLTLEVILWLCFLFPGILYSIYRVSQRKQRCAACGSAELVPAESPVGQKLARDMAHNSVGSAST